MLACAGADHDRLVSGPDGMTNAHRYEQDKVALKATSTCRRLRRLSCAEKSDKGMYKMLPLPTDDSTSNRLELQ